MLHRNVLYDYLENETKSMSLSISSRLPSRISHPPLVLKDNVIKLLYQRSCDVFLPKIMTCCARPLGV